jgi:hypothetical protein
MARRHQLCSEPFFRYARFQRRRHYGAGAPRFLIASILSGVAAAIIGRQVESGRAIGGGRIGSASERGSQNGSISVLSTGRTWSTTSQTESATSAPTA